MVKIRRNYLQSIELIKKEDVLLESYVLEIGWLINFEKLNFNKNIIFFTGENGRGKSTFLEAIAISLGFNAEGGSRSFKFKTKITHSRLNEVLRLGKGAGWSGEGFFFRSESFYNFASEMDSLDEQPAGSPFIRDSYGGKSLHQQSRGESLLSLVLNRFNSKGIYILDEPESGLSLMSQFALMRRILQLSRSGAQFIIATHSPFLITLPDADVYSVDGEVIDLIDYKETINFILARKFMNDAMNFVENSII
jgi:predicted ATPase